MLHANAAPGVRRPVPAVGRVLRAAPRRATSTGFRASAASCAFDTRELQRDAAHSRARCMTCGDRRGEPPQQPRSWRTRSPGRVTPWSCTRSPTCTTTPAGATRCTRTSPACWRRCGDEPPGRALLARDRRGRQGRRPRALRAARCSSSPPRAAAPGTTRATDGRRGRRPRRGRQGEAVLRRRVRRGWSNSRRLEERARGGATSRGSSTRSRRSSTTTAAARRTSSPPAAAWARSTPPTSCSGARTCSRRDLPVRQLRGVGITG